MCENISNQCEVEINCPSELCCGARGILADFCEPWSLRFIGGVEDIRSADDVIVKIKVFITSCDELIKRSFGGGNGCRCGHIDDASDKLLRHCRHRLRRRRGEDTMPSQTLFQGAP